MPRRRALVAFAIVFSILAPLYCRRATGIPEDPMDREALDALAAYIRIDTSNPPGNETSGAKYLQQLLTKEGIASQLVGSDPKRQSLYARLPSGTNEKALLLLHHIDVVPVNAAEWTKPPFGGVTQGGYVFGRGALDIKSLGIAELMSVIEIKRRNLPLARDVIFLATADEEMGGALGCGALLREHPELFANVGYVLNEGGYAETIVDRVSFWGIETLQKVPLWVRLHAKGTAGHGAAPPDDGGSLAKLVRALAEIDRIETPYRLLPAVERHFHAVGKTKPDERGEVMRGIRDPMDVDRIRRVLSPGYRSLLHDTIAITRIDGGTSVNSIPPHATADVDVRLLPDERTGAMLGRIRDAVGKNAEVEVLLEGEPQPETPSDTDLFRLLARDMQSDEPGSAIAPVVGAGTSDSRWFRAHGIVAYGIAPFKVNYYDADTVHASDERIRARFFTQGTRLVRRIVRDFCAREH
ncbi:MAG TPA: M20/M25/M40 family metallo-hydrolase [Thermoanaerobaculia bacterium]|nr:M20/M25/M40 family metallo-hydrolase [Thermoanaerobaculia bacterium]